MYAVIKSGGKQHKVSEGEEILLEKISLDEGEVIEFSEVLAKTSENSMTSPSSREIFSRRISSPSETLCCFPPLFITAYIFTNYKIEANSIG